MVDPFPRRLCKDCEHFVDGDCHRPVVDVVNGGLEPLRRPAKNERWTGGCGPAALFYRQAIADAAAG